MRSFFLSLAVLVCSTATTAILAYRVGYRAEMRSWGPRDAGTSPDEIRVGPSLGLFSSLPYLETILSLSYDTGTLSSNVRWESESANGCVWLLRSGEYRLAVFSPPSACKDRP